MNPFWLDGIEPGAFGGQKQGGECARPGFLPLHHLVVLHGIQVRTQLAVVPGSIIPDQQPTGFADRLQSGATPLQKLDRDDADRTTIHETERHLFAGGIGCRPLLPKHSITGNGFGIRIIRARPVRPGARADQHPGLGRQMWKRDPAPPPLVQKSDGPVWLRARPAIKRSRAVFF